METEEQREQRRPPFAFHGCPLGGWVVIYDIPNLPPYPDVDPATFSSPVAAAYVKAMMRLFASVKWEELITTVNDKGGG